MFSEEVRDPVFISLEADEPFAVGLALKVIGGCLSRDPNAIAVNVEHISSIIHRFLMTESTDGVVELIHFLTELHTNIPNLSDELMDNFVSPVTAVSQAREIETEESQKDTSIFLRFADMERIEDYFTKIPEDPIRYLALLGHITDLRPVDILSLIMMAASAAILAFENSEQKCVVKRFCNRCLGARGVHSEWRRWLRSAPVTWLVI
jgi:hypothetical protein